MGDLTFSSKKHLNVDFTRICDHRDAHLTCGRAKFSFTKLLRLRFCPLIPEVQNITNHADYNQSLLVGHYLWDSLCQSLPNIRFLLYCCLPGHQTNYISTECARNACWEGSFHGDRCKTYLLRSERSKEYIEGDTNSRIHHFLHTMFFYTL